MKIQINVDIYPKKPAKGVPARRKVLNQAPLHYMVRTTQYESEEAARKGVLKTAKKTHPGRRARIKSVKVLPN